MSRSTCLALAVLASTFAPRASVARADRPLSDFQTWMQVQGTYDLGHRVEGLSLSLETTVRRGTHTVVDQTTGAHDPAGLTYLFVRPFLEYRALPYLSIALGYAYAPVFYDDPALRSEENVAEHRVWEQLTLSHSFAGLSLASRTRQEERIRTDGPGAGEVELRLRQRFRVAYTPAQAPRLSFVATDELFFFFNETRFASTPGFSENRGFVGLGYTDASNRISFEVGYLNQHVGGHGAHHANHVLSTSTKIVFGGERSHT